MEIVNDNGDSVIGSKIFCIVIVKIVFDSFIAWFVERIEDVDDMLKFEIKRVDEVFFRHCRDEINIVLFYI